MEAAQDVAAGAAAASAAPAAAAAAAASDPEQAPFLLYMLPTLVMGLSFLVVLRVFKNLPRAVLADVIYWHLPKAEDQQQQQQQGTGSAPSPSSGSGKRGRKVAKAAAAKAATQQSGAGPGLACNYLDANLMGRMEFTDEYDYLLQAALLLIINTSAAVAIKTLLSPAFPVQSFNLFITAVVFVMYFLFQAEWGHNTIGTQEKAIMATLAAVSAVTCMGLLLSTPPGSLPFEPGAAVFEATSRMSALVRARFKGRIPAEAVAPFDDPLPAAAVLSLFGGLLGGLLLSPGIRYGRVLHSFGDMPSWAQVLRPGPTARLVVAAGFGLQLLLTPLFVTVTADVLRLPPDTLVIVRGLAMLLVGALQLAAVPHLVQVFLHLTPLHAHVVYNNPAVPESTKTTVVRKTVSTTLSHTMRVALQLSFVPVLLLSCALMYLLASFTSPLAGEAGVSDMDTRPSKFLLCITGFLAWWSSSIYLFWASMGLVLGRVSAAGLVS